MLTVEEIRAFIDNDEKSEKKQMARMGQRYYDGVHDIMGKRIFFMNDDGKLVEDKLRINTKISHPFFRELVDQAVQYVLSGKEGFIKSDDPALQKELDERFNNNEDFQAEINEIVEGCMVKGFEFAYGYKDENGRTVFECADGLGVIEVRAKDTDDGCEYVIYHFIDRIEKNSKEIKRIQVWTDTETHFFCQVDDGEIEPDPSVEKNPRPHTIYKKNGDKKLYQKGFGHIPFYRLDNNRKQESDLKLVKDLIDDYDVHSCSLTDNIEGTNEALYVVKGFKGNNLDELMFNIRNKKVLGLPGSKEVDASVDIKTVDIPVEARKAKMEMDEKNIFRFGFGLNTADLKDTSATTSIAIKAAYFLLDLKANKMEIRLKQFLRKLIAVVLEDINKEMETDYTQADVYFAFEREIPTNAQEMAQIELLEAQTQNMHVNTLLSLETKLGNETIVQNICDVMDIDYEEIKDKLPAPEEITDPYQAKTTLEQLPTEPDDGGEVIE